MVASAKGTVLERPTSTTLGTWGTSSAVRIPKRVCESVGISAGSRLTVQDGKDERGSYILIRPVDRDHHRSYGDAPYASIDEIFSGYEEDWRPSEFDWGEDTGAEAVR